MSFFNRWSEPDEEEELKQAIIKYVGGKPGASGAGSSEETGTGGESLDDISSPMDSGIGMKKRMHQMAEKAKAETKQPAATKQGGGVLGIADCDLGASPVMTKGAIFNKKDGGGGKSSPLFQARQFYQGKK